MVHHCSLHSVALSILLIQLIKGQQTELPIRIAMLQQAVEDNNSHTKPHGTEIKSKFYNEAIPVRGL